MPVAPDDWGCEWARRECVWVPDADRQQPRKGTDYYRCSVCGSTQWGPAGFTPRTPRETWAEAMMRSEIAGAMSKL